MKKIIFALMVLAGFVYSETDITVTANKIEEKKTEVASSVTVFSKEEIIRASGIEELLRRVPGLELVRSGGLGGNISVFIRGANSDHTLVYIDGIEANDPSSPGGVFDFANLSLEGIEKIEVIRGPQSVLYGSNAIGGVIKITTEDGFRNEGAKLFFEGGSYSTFTERASISGNTNSTGYSLSASQIDSKGFSSAKGGVEDDGYGATNVGGKLTAKLSDKTKLQLTGRYNRAKTDLDNFGGSLGDDPNREIKDETVLGRFSVESGEITDWLKQTTAFSALRQWYSDKNNPDESSIDLLDSRYAGVTQKSELLNEIKFSDSVSGTLGYDHKVESASSRFDSDGLFGPFSDRLDKRSIATNSGFGELVYSISESLSLRGGGRIDENSKFGSEGTYRAGVVRSFGHTRLFGTIGSGFKAPTISQLYSSFGNESLKSEDSVGYDIGIEQAFGFGNIGVTYFKNDFDNLISFNPVTFVSENIAEAESEGFETTASIELSETVSIIGSYTFTDTEDKQTKENLLRRARHRAQAGLRVKPIDRVNIDLEGILKGEREDLDFGTGQRAELPSYTTARATLSYLLMDSLELSIRAENVFDRDYSEVLGFSTEGASIYGGVTYRQ